MTVVFDVELKKESKESCFSLERLALLNKKKVPNHIAVIPDGNRRWAKKRLISPSLGQKEGADSLMEIVRAGKKLGVKIMTFYIFSTENWTRNSEEIQALLWLIERYLQDQLQAMIENGVRIESIGDISKFPSSLIDTLQKTKEATAHCSDIEMVLALNYGGRDEICRALRKIIDDVDASLLNKQEISESVVLRYLDTSRWQDPELVIRTSGESRLSNFLLWQTSYSEIYTTSVLWPDFTPQHLLEAVLDYQGRERRLGGS